ncbi:hypothetical protein KY343_03580 [Candidatus Woesearchaeota archaeon]|nr:hypothetical protein [Candidatus Woesearchaeota archaeon]
MPTIRELMKEIGSEYESVSYGQSRVVLRYLEKEPLAYAKWYSGFLVIFKDYYGFLHAYTYATKKPFASGYQDSSFHKIQLDEAIEFLKTKEEGIICKKFDEKEVGKQKKRYERPVLGGFSYKNKEKDSSSWDHGKIRFVRLRSGMLRAEKPPYWNFNSKWERVELKWALNYLDKEEYKVTEYDVPEEVLKEAKRMVTIDEL